MPLTMEEFLAQLTTLLKPYEQDVTLQFEVTNDSKIVKVTLNTSRLNTFDTDVLKYRILSQFSSYRAKRLAFEGCLIHIVPPS